MAKFDFVESAASGYRFVWDERRAIAPLTVTPLAVKIGSFAAISLLGLEDNILRQGLLLLPAYLLEGFLVTMVIRMAMFGERFDNLFTIDQKQFSESRSRAIMAGVAVYLLTKLVSSFLSGWMMIAQKVEKMPQMPEPHGSTFITTAMILIFIIWSFRFFWLYVPAAMGISIQGFLRTIQSFSTSIYMLGLWLLCFVPLAVLLVGSAKILMLAFPGVTADDQSAIYIILISVVQAVVELLIALTGGVAMAFAVKSIMTGGSKPPRLF